MSRQNDDGIFLFLAGMTLGLFTGGLLGLLFAPKSGDELREDAARIAKTLPGKINDELKNPHGKTREFIDKTRVSIENQVGKVAQNREADRMAKAKRAEELASGYDFN